MRIISGAAKGRRLFSPGRRIGKAWIRPTADRAREALFNILASEVFGSRVLDLFAGTGALGLEALSRGAESALFVDCSPSAISLIVKNTRLCFPDESWKGSSRPQTGRGNLFRFSDSAGRSASVAQRDLNKGLFFLRDLRPEKGFSLAFIDPPYGKQLTHKTLMELTALDVLGEHGLAVAEDHAAETLPGRLGGLRLVDRRRYGDTAFWFYRLSRE